MIETSSLTVDKTTKFEDFQYFDEYVSSESRERISSAAVEELGDYYDLTIGQFIELIHLTEQDISERFDTVFGVYWLRGFKDFVDEFVKTLNNLYIKPTSKEMVAQDVCYPVEFDESMLVFTRSYFNLPSFKDAEKITIGEFLIAKKDAYNSAAFERKLSEITLNETKKFK